LSKKIITERNYKPPQKKQQHAKALIRISGGAKGCRRRGRGRGSVFEVLHARLLLLLVPDAVIHVRFELLLALVSVSEFKLLLINPLRNPPQLAGVISLDGIDGIGGLPVDPLLENLVGSGDFGFGLALQQQLRLQLDNRRFSMEITL
jgi:hypothetical protein